ncbi:hypothetical protein OOK60_08960 [Trichothermofontia sichuanensis B231]|uniref:hypothetical protein n=1 Tax=Trichothermofontia sichuanensis TaxID=3045816 RepID=UPI002246FBBB|nr:hypothetical protein [Trichothermofontia sichuanensis]UZQ56162.1 hypothetical protein OOK60_08960 [Trichothermofontia sichuanensis B231]
MPTTSTSSSDNDDVAFSGELPRYNSPALTQRGPQTDFYAAPVMHPGSEGLAKQDGQRSQSSLRSFAVLIAPLRDRDIKALDTLFHYDGIEEVEADIAQVLLTLFPEPCWEDDPFEFLREYL